MEGREIGQLEENREIEWRIEDFFTVFADKNVHFYDSPIFFIESMPYYLRLLQNCSGWLYLKSDDEQECPVEYEFGLKTSDGTVVKEYNGLKVTSLIFLSEIMSQESDFTPDNVLTILCTLKSKPHPSLKFLLGKMESLKLTRLDKLSENFKDLFDDQESCDVILKVQDKEYKAHRTVLVARSKVFAAYFRHDTLESQTGVITIPDCDPDSFQEFLKYLYYGKLELSSSSSAMNLYITSDKYDVQVLRAFCVEYLMQSLTVDNVCEVAIFVNKNQVTQLSSAVQDFFNKNFRTIFESFYWGDLLERDFSVGKNLLKGMSPKMILADPRCLKVPRRFLQRKITLN